MAGNDVVCEMTASIGGDSVRCPSDETTPTTTATTLAPDSTALPSTTLFSSTATQTTSISTSPSTTASTSACPALEDFELQYDLDISPNILDSQFRPLWLRKKVKVLVGFRIWVPFELSLSFSLTTQIEGESKRFSQLGPTLKKTIFVPGPEFQLSDAALGLIPGMAPIQLVLKVRRFLKTVSAIAELQNLFKAGAQVGEACIQSAPWTDLKTRPRCDSDLKIFTQYAVGCATSLVDAWDAIGSFRDKARFVRRRRDLSISAKLSCVNGTEIDSFDRCTSSTLDEGAENSVVVDEDVDDAFVANTSLCVPPSSALDTRAMQRCFCLNSTWTCGDLNGLAPINATLFGPHASAPCHPAQCTTLLPPKHVVEIVLQESYTAFDDGNMTALRQGLAAATGYPATWINIFELGDDVNGRLRAQISVFDPFTLAGDQAPPFNLTLSKMLLNSTALEESLTFSLSSTQIVASSSGSAADSNGNGGGAATWILVAIVVSVSVGVLFAIFLFVRSKRAARHHRAPPAKVLLAPNPLLSEESQQLPGAPASTFSMPPHGIALQQRFPAWTSSMTSLSALGQLQTCADQEDVDL